MMKAVDTIHQNRDPSSIVMPGLPISSRCDDVHVFVEPDVSLLLPVLFHVDPLYEQRNPAARTQAPITTSNHHFGTQIIRNCRERLASDATHLEVMSMETPPLDACHDFFPVDVAYHLSWGNGPSFSCLRVVITLIAIVWRKVRRSGAYNLPWGEWLIFSPSGKLDLDTSFRSLGAHIPSLSVRQTRYRILVAW